MNDDTKKIIIKKKRLEFISERCQETAGMPSENPAFPIFDMFVNN